jgi:putative tryptophan/tyrosine transport system substrate-binding protein
MPVIGFLAGASAAEWVQNVAAFRRGLGEIGYVEGRNVTIDYRWADGRFDVLPALAADLVRHHVTVLVAGGGHAVTLAAKGATTSIPIRARRPASGAEAAPSRAYWARLSGCHSNRVQAT